MTHQALARKWRPKDFASLIGQEHVVKALTHALEQQRLHHAYLFSGTRGVGKTTLARILAKALTCETGITAAPCGRCRMCVEIDAVRSVDYLEMDAASNRSVEEISALLERAVYAPVAARFKIYMIDEVHMLTQHAFNAMLKTLEEPPPHIKFILATTDPKKIPVTVLSRCLQFNLKPMPAAQIAPALEKILNAEDILFEPQALRLLAHTASGSMRDALSLTDQAIAYTAHHLNAEAIRDMLGIVEQRCLIQLLDALVERNGPALLHLAEEMAAQNVPFAQALQDLASLLHQIAWYQYAPNSISESEVHAEDIRRFAGTLTPEDVQLYYQIATLGRSELGLAPDEYAGFTMTLLRMLAFRSVPRDEQNAGSTAADRAASEKRMTPPAPEFHSIQPSAHIGASSPSLPAPHPEKKMTARAAASPARAALDTLNGVCTEQDQAMAQCQKDAEHALKQEAFVQALGSELDATLLPGSVQPISPSKRATK